VTWLACHNDPVHPNKTKYIYLSSSCRYKGNKDLQKFEKARNLKSEVTEIRRSYMQG
jgi:DNA topoisomerase-1